MKNKFIIYQIFLILCSTLLLGDEPQRVWIYFVDKGDYQNKNIETVAKNHLSDKSISRRAAKSVPIKYDFTDLPINQEYINDLKKSGISIIHKSKWFNSISAIINESQYKELINLNYIKQITPVKSFRFRVNEETESIASYKITNEDYGLSANQNQMLGIPAFHSRGYDGSGVLIALFDTGFRLDHDALAIGKCCSKLGFCRE